MPLAVCDVFHGGRVLRQRDPDCATHTDVLYVPAVGPDAFTHRRFGLFGADGFLLPGAGKQPGPDGVPNGAAPFSAVSRQGLPCADGPFFYMGLFTSHYGHFIIDTLTRLWAWAQFAPRRPKILIHGRQPAANFFAAPFIREVFAALGLGPEDFVSFDTPMRLGEVIIPHPAFAELNHTHTAFARFMNDLGARLCPGPAVRVDRPVYLTKKNVTSGVSHFVNEAAFAERLARAGVEVIAPETLSLAEQVVLFRTRAVVSGLIGSAFHTSAFAPPSRLVMLNYHRTLWTNQLLLDQANGNEALYLYDTEESRHLGSNEHFMNRFEMADPVGLAEDFLRRLDSFTTAPPRPAAISAPHADAVSPSPSEDERKYRYAICACARWETPYVVEWLNYYRALGFDHVYLYCNDDDPTALYAQVLPFTQGSAPFVTFRYHPYQGQQSQMYSHFLRHGLAQTQWISFFDLDEFLRLPPGESIAQFMARFPEGTDCVLFNWIFFGPNGHKHPPAGRVLENFTRREDAIHPLTKFVCRSQVLTGEKIHDPEEGHGFWHRPNGYVAAEVNTVSVLGEDMCRYYEGFPERAKAYANDPVRKERLLATAMIHHYAFRSENAFLERAERGLGGNFHGQTTWREHAQGPNFERLLRMFNAIPDTRLARFWPDLLQAAWNTSTLAQAKALPLSRGKPTRQSSSLNDPEFLARAANSQGATGGMRNGVRKFHTDFEENPWWQVDLGGFATIREIHIYNTDDHTAARFRNFMLSVSIDGIAWVELTRKEDEIVVGGVTGAPFIWDGPGTAWARYVRVTLLGRDYLHLDQVEVFGQMS